MNTANNFESPQPVFAPMGLTDTGTAPNASPSEGPFDWAQTYGADSFVFQPDAASLVSTTSYE